MKKLILFIAMLLMSFACFGQTKAVTKVARSFSSKGAKKAAMKAMSKEAPEVLLREGIARTGSRYSGEALGKQIVKKVMRDDVMKRMEKEGMESFLEYGTSKAMKELGHMGVSDVKKNILKRGAATATRPSAYHLAIEKYSKREGVANTSKIVVKKTIAKYAGKEGYREFMKMSIRERMLEIRNLTKSIFNLPKVEQEKALASLSSEMKEKVLATRNIMTSRLPSTKKGYFKGARGNSDFVLSDNYVWKDPKTGEKLTVGELRKKYNIKDPIVISYHDGEPDFSKYAIGKVNVAYRDDINYKDLKGLHDQATEKLAQEDWVRKNQHSDAVNPTRDVIENMSTDRKYKRGCRNTYHETWDGETILVVPDFINSACTHNGGRALAQIVQK